MPSPVSPPRDTLRVRKLCEVYLQNVDPIIKVLHRPTLTRWMIYDGSPYTGPSIGDNMQSAQTLECAVCYAAATTMTEAQCQTAFQKSKVEVSTIYRKMCEDAIERAGLLTTRDMTVLQAFVLYLVGRRSEDKGTAVWALVALAVRLTSAMKLNHPPSDREETFFQQQMRLRLWLTVCLMDLQASLAESSEPLISYRDAASAVPLVHNINDADFDVDTVHTVDSSEELTDTTFALVTYRVQVIGRLLNFPPSEPGVSGSVITSPPLDPEGRRQLVRQFKQEVFGLLHYCDPESSPYAWFTWHSTHCIVAAIRLSELLPFRCGPAGGQRQPLMQRRSQDVTEVLCRALQNLEKAQVIHSDPRSDGFRWYIAVPRLALSTAIAECSTCADTAVVRWAWPIIETFFRQYEESVSSYKCSLSQVPLQRLMSEARERLAPLLQGGVSLNEIQVATATSHHALMSLDADGSGD
ncbi:cupin -type protein [Purpureocillium lavendulum]|uniref:Cupin -type protein n=1 Tax=Purpureocillium lavendulum TaxID=1247861 RepID=A0AB34FWA7_9HYPO|nr:cupin -type protein [Purpureocillium lavendulum]